MSFCTYILRLSNGIYYTGHTDDLERRLAEHQRGEVKGFTSRHRPVELMWAEEFPTRDDAFAAEWRIGGWSRKKKEALFAGDWQSVSHFAKPPSRRVPPQGVALDTASRQARHLLGMSGKGDARTAHLEPVSRLPRHGVSTGSTPARDERAMGSEEIAHLEPASSEVEARRRETPPAIVLVRPQLGENIGKAARAMLNFGLTDLRLVAPRDGWPNPAAAPAASGADMVLENARVFGSVAEAVADCPFVYATTVRKRGLVVPVVTAEEAGREIRSNAGASAILFGAERSGLETEEVAIAQKILTIPVNPQFRSLNLAQAVIIAAYEWSKHEALAVPTDAGEAEPRATQEQLEGLIGQMDEALDKAGYYFPPDRTPTTRQTMRTILSKAGWSNREIQALRGMIRALVHPRDRGKRE